jgi:hypothetical protein
MSVTILEVLQNAEVNLVINRNNSLAFAIGKEQIANAIAQLEKNPDASAMFVEKFAEDVPVQQTNESH